MIKNLIRGQSLSDADRKKRAEDLILQLMGGFNDLDFDDGDDDEI